MIDANEFPRFSLRTLGSFELSVRTTATSAATAVVLGEKSCAVIAYLWLADRHIPRETLCELLWDGIGTSDARNNLRQALFRIRRVLGPEAIQEDARGLWLSAPHLDVDLAPFVAAEKGGAAPLLPATQPFGVMRQPMGERFLEWRDAVRRRFGGQAAGAPREDMSFAESGDDYRHPLGQAQVLESLVNAWQLSVRGVAMSAWVAAAPGVRRHDAVRIVRNALREHGASVASVVAPARGARGKASLWASVATALWSKPGAMGVAPEHLRLLEDVPGAFAVDVGAARLAVLDLVRAVADERPLAIIVEDAMAYANGLTEGLVRSVAAMRGTPVLLVLVAPPQTPPVSPICLALSGFGESKPANVASALRASRRSAG